MLTKHSLVSYFYQIDKNKFFSDVFDREEQEFTIEKVEPHENFNIGPYLNNDIAIVTIR